MSPLEPDTLIRGNSWISWNGNISHSFENSVRITSEDQLIETMTKADSFRPFGTAQSSADICAGTKTIADLRAYNQFVSVDKEKKQIRAQSGILLRDLLLEAQTQGWTIPCLPDNDSITLGGALATGTHGTSGGSKTLAEYVTSCSLVQPDGSLREVTRGDEFMDALGCSLGLLGVMSEITIQFEDAKRLFISEEPVRDEEWLEKWPQWLKENYFLRILYIPHSGYGWVIKGNPIPEGQEPATVAAPEFNRHRREFSRRLYAVPNPAFSRMSNRLMRKLFFSKPFSSVGDLYEATVTKKRSSTMELAEWTVAQDRFNETFADFTTALKKDRRAFAHIPMDVRFVSADQTWLSNAYQRDMVTVGCVTRTPRRADKYRAFDIIERSFLAHEGRPHWAKHFSANAEQFAALYPRWDEFIQLRRQIDPQGKLLNEYLGTIFT